MMIKRAALIGLLTISSILTAAVAVRADQECCSPGAPGQGKQEQEPVFQDLGKPGKKCWIGEAHYFTWEFDKTPKMGTAILIVKLYDREGKRVSDLAVTGRSDMPSMRGAHDSGEVAFKLNKAGDFLLPVNVVMPGDWEVRLTFSRDGVVVFRGRVTFDV
jgi:hypothetical protein